ncbi:PadR family transcriptional regulator [Leucobacter coleopterorum]|uniref:PadR family transcriptional regulator n=1 Tax=Leucobacter coleopterorum TaxID=2714933 RepID=A0ABX6JU17_9MICO|nr:PadR family transcriptional regulator [Leucobacter coleopterorum]QIM17718.1 PadR family transcriptional regulator [Leucobacter coleopterorum]
MPRNAVKLTPLGIMLLALLFEDDMHPYEMLCLLKQRKRDRLVPVTKGALYHTVARLEKEHYIAEVSVDRKGNRPERTTYTLLELGREAVTTWVRHELPRIDHPTAYGLALAEAHNLPLEEVIELLTQRRDMLADALATLEAELAATREEGTPEQYLLNFERTAILLAADLRSNTAAIERISTPNFQWGGGVTTPAKYQLHRKAAQQ